MGNPDGKFCIAEIIILCRAKKFFGHRSLRGTLVFWGSKAAFPEA
jgi:hypothetical protein